MMNKIPYDVVVVTDSRYVSDDYTDEYAANVALEDRLLIDALQNQGLKATKKAWDDSQFNWSDTRFVLISSTWDYFHRFTEFVAWLKSVSEVSALINDYKTLKWNSDKIYLKELNQKGIAIPQTHFVAPNSGKSLETLYHELNWSKIVIKPTVGGGGRHTYLISQASISDYSAAFSEVNEHEAFMIQEYQRNIASKGEISLMFFGGVYSHAVLKKAKPGDFRVQDDFGGTYSIHNSSIDELQFARQVLDVLPKRPVYARVDIIWDNENRIVLSELELIEPELWLRLDKNAANNFTKAVSAEIRTTLGLSNQ